MSADALKLSQIDCSHGGVLKILGEHHGVVTMVLEGVIFQDTSLAARKIAAKFGGQCIFTSVWESKTPHFTFTKDIGEKIKDPKGFLENIHNEIQATLAEVRLLSA